MAETINYIWQSSFCLLFFYGVYWCFLKEEKAFNLTRGFILIAPLMALFFPIIEIPVNFAKPDISLEDSGFLQALTVLETKEETIGTYGLPEFTVEGTKLPLLMELKDYLIIGYLLVVVLLGLRLYWQFRQIHQLFRKGWYQTVFKLNGGFFLTPTFGLSPIFSFFDKVFWDETQALSISEKNQIIQHELAHIRQGHSWDVLYYQILAVLFWFNPAVHLMRTALVDTHEYMADAQVLQTSENKALYRRLIVRMAFKGLDLPIGNYFIRSTTLKRITMMKKPRKTNWIKLVMVGPLTAMLLALVSLKTLPDPQLLGESRITDLSAIKQLITAAHDSIQVSTKVKRIKSPAHYEYISSLKNGKITAQFGDLQYEIGDISSLEEYRKVLEMLEVFKTSSSFKKDFGIDGLARRADKMPVPKGGLEVWNNFLAYNLKMPAEARELGVDGYVYAQFVVDKKGEIKSPTILKSLGMGLDDEVLRILALPDVPDWSPGENDGEAVNTLMTIPVRFRTEQTAEREPFFPVPSAPASPASKTSHGETVYDVVEDMPNPPGGVEGWNEYISNNLKYPEGAKKKGIEGTVYLIFTVDKEGKITAPSILRGIGGGADEEALRLVQNSPAWNPGMQRGQQVAVRMRLPIRFKLPTETGKAENPEILAPRDKIRPHNTLNEVTVVGYGSSEGYITKHTTAGNTFAISISEEGEISLNGKIVDTESLEQEIQNHISALEDRDIAKNQIVASIKADAKTGLGKIHDIQEILRKAGIRKVEYSNFE